MAAFFRNARPVLSAGNIVAHRIICHNYPIQMSLFFFFRVQMILAVAYSGARPSRGEGDVWRQRLRGSGEVNGRAQTHSLVALSPAPGVLLSPRESNVEMSYGSATGLVEYLSASDYLHSDLPTRPVRWLQLSLSRWLTAGGVLNSFHLHRKT